MAFLGPRHLGDVSVHQGCRMATKIRFHPRKGITILVADDFEVFRRFVRQKLLENGFQAVAEAADGLEAVKKAAEIQPDLVLLDIGMPKLNGIEEQPKSACSLLNRKFSSFRRIQNRSGTPARDRGCSSGQRDLSVLACILPRVRAFLDAFSQPA